MLTPEQLKGRIRNIAREKNLSPQEVLQMYLFERVIGTTTEIDITMQKISSLKRY